MDQHTLRQLEQIARTRHELGMSVETWERLAGSPDWYRDRYIAIDHFEDNQSGWEITENVVAEAACDGEPFDFFFLSLLVNCVPGHALEADFGAGEYQRESRPGNMIFGDESTARKLQGVGPFHSIVLYIPKQRFLSQASEIMEQEICSLESLHTHTFRDDGLETLVKELVFLYRNPLSSSMVLTQDEVKDAIVERLLVQAKQSPPELGDDAKLHPPAVGRTIEFLRANCHRDIGRDEMAAVAGVSPAHFSRLFRQTVGIAPQRYLLMLRIELAKHWLQRLPKGAPTSSIAQQCGFADKSHFGREFRRVVGVTPGMYRRHH